MDPAAILALISNLYTQVIEAQQRVGALEEELAKLKARATESEPPGHRA